MNRWSHIGFANALFALLALSACGDDPLTSRPTTTGSSSSSSSGSSSTSSGSMSSDFFVRIHYRTQDGSASNSWGVHFWGAGSTSPEWGTPQLFDQSDAFGTFTDVKITSVEDMTDAWLGVLPVQCDANKNCKKDIETGVRFFDLQKNKDNPNIAECWITQGQTIQIAEPSSSGPAYHIHNAKDFIDLGDGRVRLMFRVAPKSTGMVEYGTDPGTLNLKAMWTETDDINKTGLIIDQLGAGVKTYYKISSTLKTADNQMLSDATGVLELTPVGFAPVDQAADFANWGSQGLMYQLIVRTFADGGSPKSVTDAGAESGIDPAAKDGIGDLVGLRSMLPYLKDMGVDAIWMTPIFAAKSYHGYDTTDFYEIDPAVGTRKDFVDLAAEADTLGINLILDLVQNHVADVNPWFVAGADPKNPDYAKYHGFFQWADEYSNMLADKHPWDASEVIWACRNYMCYHKIFGGGMPELNYRNPEVRAEMKKISEFWLKLGADGFRLDASKHIEQFDDNNSTELSIHGTHVWWKEFNDFVKRKAMLAPGAPKVLLAGENRWDEPTSYGLMIPYGSDMDSQFDFPFRSVVSNFVNGQAGDAVDFVKYHNQLKADLAMPAKGGNPNHFFQRFLSNHDLERPATQFEGLGGADLTALLKQTATIVLTMPGMPVVYYGEEFGKKGKRDKYLGTEGWDHDEFIREPMSWFENISFSGDMMASYDIDYMKTNGANAALNLGAGICKAPNPDYSFIKYMSETEPASWAAQKDDPNSLYNYYKTLVGIRKANAAMFTAADTVLATVQNTADWYEFSLTNGNKTMWVVLNRKNTMQTATRPMPKKDLISGNMGSMFSVPAYGALILE